MYVDILGNEFGQFIWHFIATKQREEFMYKIFTYIHQGIKCRI